MNVIIKLEVEGIHYWKEAPKEVGFLRHPHRHIFHITAEKAVGHNDRDIEIIMFKRNVLFFLKSKHFNDTINLHDFGKMSCEDIADKVGNYFSCTSVTVLEDNENGAIWRSNI